MTNTRKKTIVLIILFTILIVISAIYSLRKDKTTEKLLIQMLSTKVDLCLSRMEHYAGYDYATNDDMIRNCNPKYKLISYTDSVGCTPCFISRISDWKEVAEELFIDSCRSFKILFVFSPSQSNIQKVKQVVENTSSDWPIYIDTAHVFLQANKQIPLNSMFHTFLLNERDEILCVGNPLYNKKVRGIYKSIIRDGRRLQ